MGIGIDLGGTTIKGGIVSSEGVVLKKYTLATNIQRGYIGVLEDLVDLVEGLLAIVPNEKSIGIGVPGIISGDGGTIVSCPNLHWKDRLLKQDLESCLPVKVFLVNDATAACIAEAVFGTLKGQANGMMITLGTGVGGGLILNHRIISGVHGVATEIGHMIMGENFYDCGCGKNGCLETFASATALVRYCLMRLEQGVSSLLDQEKILNGKLIMELAKSGDSLALEAVDRLANYLGMAISNINDILDPGIFAIGGGLSYSGDFLLEKIIQATKKYLTYPDYAVPEIVGASLKNEAGIVGAANIMNYV